MVYKNGCDRDRASYENADYPHEKLGRRNFLGRNNDRWEPAANVYFIGIALNKLNLVLGRWNISLEGFIDFSVYGIDKTGGGIIGRIDCTYLLVTDSACIDEYVAEHGNTYSDYYAY